MVWFSVGLVRFGCYQNPKRNRSVWVETGTIPRRMSANRTFAQLINSELIAKSFAYVILTEYVN